jgi:hypothetical protein
MSNEESSAPAGLFSVQLYGSTKVLVKNFLLANFPTLVLLQLK